MALTLTGVQPGHIGEKYDIAIGFDDGTGKVEMVGYVQPKGATWTERTLLADEGSSLRSIASPNQIDSRDLTPWVKVSQGDWTGGERQFTFLDPKRYYQSDGGMDVTKEGGLQLLPSAVVSTTLPAGFTIDPSYCTAGPLVLGGSVGGAAAVAIGATAYTITGATGSVTDLAEFFGFFYAACGNGIWRFVLTAGVPGSFTQMTSDVPTGGLQMMAYGGDKLYYSVGQELKSVSAALGNNPGTGEHGVSVFEGNILVMANSGNGIFFATAGGLEAQFYIWDGTTAERIAVVRGEPAHAVTVNGVTYVICGDVGNEQYLLYTVTGTTVAELDDTRYVLSDFGNTTGPFGPGPLAHLAADGRFLYVAWPGMPGLRYDTVNGGVSRIGTGQFGPTSATYLAHRITLFNGLVYELVATTAQVEQLTYTQAPTVGRLITSYYDFGTPTIPKVFRSIEVELTSQLAPNAAVNIFYHVDTDLAWHPLAVRTLDNDNLLATLPAGIIGSRIQFLFELVAGGGVSPVVALWSIYGNMGRVWDVTLSCRRSQTDRSGERDTAQEARGVDLMANLENAYTVNAGRCVLYVPSPTAGNPSSFMGAPFVELVHAVMLRRERTVAGGVTPSWSDDEDGAYDMEGDVRVVFAETIAQPIAGPPPPPPPEEDMPIGAIVAFGGATPPTDWLLCDGTLYNTTTYAALFGVIGYQYGGSGALFAVPDVRGKVLMGTSVAHPLGSSGGEETHTLSTAEIPAHAHGVTDPQHRHGIGGDTGSRIIVTEPTSTLRLTTSGAAQAVSFVPLDPAATGVSIQNAGGGSAHNNLQPFLAATAIIRFA